MSREFVVVAVGGGIRKIVSSNHAPPADRETNMDSVPTSRVMRTQRTATASRRRVTVSMAG